MGISTNIYLPGNVRFKDVMTVIGVTVGLDKKKRDIGGGSYYVDVDGIQARTYNSQPDMVNIEFGNRFCHWFFEHYSDLGDRVLLCGDSDFWRIVGNRLVDFFGGYVDYDDCDEIDFDYEVPMKSNSENRPTSGEPWKNLQERIWNAPRIHRSELNVSDNNIGEGGYVYRFDEEGYLTYA